jgi:hypothetical protein
MTATSLLPFGTAPVRPSEPQLPGARGQRQGHLKQAPDFGHRQFGQERFARPLFSTAWLRIEANQAWAIIESVICRYQLCQ